MLRFSEEDVVKLAEGVMREPIEYNYNDNGPDYHYCKFCFETHRKERMCSVRFEFVLS